MSQLLNLTISRVDGAVFDGAVESVRVPGIAGEMTVLGNHKPLISPLKAGTITITKEDKSSEEISIEGGTLEISNNRATILV